MSSPSIHFFLLLNSLNIYLTVTLVISAEPSESSSFIPLDQLNASLLMQSETQLDDLAKSTSRNSIESSKLEITDEDFRKQLKNRQLGVGSCPISLLAITSCPLVLSTASTSIDSNNTPYTFYYYKCSSSSTSSTTCSTALVSCGVSCTSAIVSSTGYTYYSYATIKISDTWILATQTSQSSTSIGSLLTSYGCDALSAACSLSSSAAILMKKAIGGAAVAFGSGIGLGVAIANVGLIQPSAVQAKNDDIADVPINALEIPVPGPNLLNQGGCNDSSIMFPGDGNCYPVLKQGPCASPFEWLTVDPRTLLGKCSPRICSQGQVFVGRDGLCHDIDDPKECQGGRRLYYTAYGDPICDCRIGQFPFPQPENDCVPLFTQGPCPIGQIVTFSQTGALICSMQTNSRNQFAYQHKKDQVTESGYQLQLPQTFDRYALLECHNPTLSSPKTNNNPYSPSANYRQKFLFGYDVFTFKSVCVDILASESPYFNSMPENQLLDEQPGVFQGPDPLLIPCRPGAKTDKNFKCTNPLVPTERKQILLKTVGGNFVCPDNATLQATGHCGSSQSASCGPSFEFDEDIGECQSIFE